MDTVCPGRAARAKMEAMHTSSAVASRRHDVADVLRQSLGGGLGLFPLGVAFGMMVVQAGMPWWIAPVLSIVVYAGSVEMLLVGLLAAGTPVVTMTLMTLLVNFRHVFYAFSFPLRLVRNPLARAYSIYALTDETYAITTGHPTGWNQRRLLILQVALQAYWVVGGIIGTAFAGLLPAPIEGLEFALVALFTVLALDAARTKAQLPSVLLGAGSLAVGLLAFPDASLLASLVLFSAGLVVRHLARRRRA